MREVQILQALKGRPNNVDFFGAYENDKEVVMVLECGPAAASVLAIVAHQSPDCPSAHTRCCWRLQVLARMTQRSLDVGQAWAFFWCVDVFSCHVQAGIVVMLFECSARCRLCKGGELFKRLLAKGRYSERDASVVMRQILQSIADCHVHGALSAAACAWQCLICHLRSCSAHHSAL